MKKPNLRSIKGPNKAAKYAKLMEKYRKYRSSIVKSPGGKVVKSPGGKLAKNAPGGKLAKSPGGKVVKSPGGKLAKSPKAIVKSVKGKLAKTPNKKGVISETANFSRDKVTAKGTRTGQPGKPIKGLLEGRKGVGGQQYKAPKLPKSARKTSRTGRFVDRVTSQQKQSAKGLGKRLNKLNRFRKTNKVLREGNPSKILKATEKAQRTAKITRGARSLRGVLNPKNLKNLSSIKTLGAGIALNALADVGTRRLSRSISNRIRKSQGKNTETQKEYNARITKLKSMSRSERNALKNKNKTVKAKTPIVSAGGRTKNKSVVKPVVKKTSTPTKNNIPKIKASNFDSRKPKVEKKVTPVVNKKVTPVVNKKVTPVVNKTKKTVTPAVNKTKKPSINQFRRTKGEGIDMKGGNGYRGDTKITAGLKKSGFTETRLAKLREKNAAFQKAKKGGKKAMKAYREKYKK